MKDLRKVACEIAKRLAQENGGKPNEFLKDGWRLAKEGKTPDQVVKQPKTPNKQVKTTGFYLVDYKGQFGGSYKTIVPANNVEEATRKFYDPDDEFGPKNQVKSVAVARKIPKTYEVTIEPEYNVLVTVKIDREINLMNWDETFTGKVKDKVYGFTLRDIVSANPAKKEAVMKKGTRV